MSQNDFRVLSHLPNNCSNQLLVGFDSFDAAPAALTFGHVLDAVHANVAGQPPQMIQHVLLSDNCKE